MKKLKLFTLGIFFTFFFFTSCKGQTPLQLQQTYSTEIIGTWESNDEAGHKLEFTSNGRMKIYSENEYIGYSNYSIVITCKDQTISDGRIFLRLEEDGDANCQTLEAVNNNNSGVLSITSEQGKLETYTRVN